MHKKVLFFTQQGVKEINKCELTNSEKSILRNSEEARESALQELTGPCWSSIFESNHLKSLESQSIKRKVDVVDFIEISFLWQDNMPQSLMRELLEKFPEKILLPTGRWIKCKENDHYFFLFDPKKDRYLQGVKDMGEITKVLGL